MILITTYYVSSNEDRNNEIKKCLLMNIENKNIDKIYLLNNQNFDLSFIKDKTLINKVEQIIISLDDNYILNYKDAIMFINNKLKNKICILSNSDIYFDDSLSMINPKNIIGNFYALLRYDEDQNGIKQIFTRFNKPRNDSQDCWIFKSPLKIDLSKIDFTFRTLGCDSLFAKYVYDTGLKVSNPSYDIITVHVHNTDFRTYNCDNRIHGQYCLIQPCHLNEYIEPTFMDY
jgi:hypothetical protein